MFTVFLTASSSNKSHREQHLSDVFAAARLPQLRVYGGIFIAAANAAAAPAVSGRAAASPRFPQGPGVFLGGSVRQLPSGLPVPWWASRVKPIAWCSGRSPGPPTAGLLGQGGQGGGGGHVCDVPGSSQPGTRGPSWGSVWRPGQKRDGPAEVRFETLFSALQSSLRFEAP